jgi:hypothetical protein
MDQTSPLSDVLLKGSSALSGLLSQMSGTGNGPSALDGLFSSLISEKDALQSANANGAREITPPTLPRLSSPESSKTIPCLDQTMKSAGDLLSTLHKILAVLHRDQAAASAKQGGNSADASGTKDSSLSEIPPVVSTIMEDPTEAAQLAEESASSDSTEQNLSELVLELLTMMQLIVRALQQSPFTDGGTSAPQGGAASAIQASADATNSLMTGTETNQDGVDATDLLSGSMADSSVTNIDSLLYLLKAAQNTAEQLLDAFAQGVSSGEAAVSIAPSDMGVLLAQLQADIRDVLAALKEQRQADLAAKETPISAETAAAALTTTEGLASALAPSDKTQTPVIDASALSHAAQVAAALAAAKTKGTTKEQATKAETLTENENLAPAAALTKADEIANVSADAQNNGDLLSESDMSSGNEKFFSLANAGSNLSPPLAAGGTQATGVYSFASTLSAFRTANGGTTGLPSIVDQVLLHINRNVKNGESQMSLQLQPSDLGKISVKLEFGADGKVQGSVVADNPRTLEMLQKDSRSLERALQDAGLRAEPGSLQFGLSGEKNPHNAAQTANSEGKNSGNGAENDTLGVGDNTLEIADSAAISEAYYITPTGVNIRV